MARFRLMGGQHVEADRSKPLLHPETGKPTGRFQPRTYKAGDVVETDKDLLALFGTDKFQVIGGEAEAARAQIAKLEQEIAALHAKQAVLSASPVEPQSLAKAPVTAPPGDYVSAGFQGTQHASDDEGDDDAGDGLENMAVNELRTVAVNEGCTLKRTDSKNEIIALIRAHRAE